jgi:hypothetical protein
MNLPPGQFEQLFVVCLGSFNPKIFQPEWFVRHSLMTEEEASSSKIHGLSELVANLEIQNIILQCVNNRLSIGTMDATRFDMIRDLFVGMFTLLPHTPIAAIGINPGAHFPTPSAASWHRVGNALAPKEDVWNALFDQPGMQSLTILAQRSGEWAGPTRATVEPSMRLPNGLFVGVNYHYDLPPKDPMGALLRFVASDWQIACLETKRVGRRIFEQLVS